jgi:hypothetical protein
VLLFPTNRIWHCKLISSHFVFSVSFEETRDLTFFNYFLSRLFVCKKLPIFLNRFWSYYIIYLRRFDGFWLGIIFTTFSLTSRLSPTLTLSTGCSRWVISANPISTLISNSAFFLHPHLNSYHFKQIDLFEFTRQI